MRINLINLATLVSLPTITIAANIAYLPQTGQSITVPTGCTSGCFTSPAGSDGVLQKGVAWPSPRFAVDTSGNCISDKLTGLMWVRNLNSVNNGATLNWSSALNTAENGTWCGYSDWRTPNINELRSLVNYGESDNVGWLNSPISSGGAGFSNVFSGLYWTSSIYFGTSIRTLNMSTSAMGSTAATASQRLFPVRGGQ